MKPPPAASPFVPGHGQMPPYLARREDEQGKLSDLQYRDRLASIGYVWKPPGAEDVWRPSIPSLMDYVRSHTP